MTLDIPDWFGALIAFLFGASVGSFVNVVAYRLPREISIATPRSFCAECNRPIPCWANIPILAYLGLRGRCLMCGATIPFRHFLAEICSRGRRRLPLSALPAARRAGALRVLRGALYRRADRLRLAADSEHHNLSRNSDRIDGRHVYDSGSRPEALADRHRASDGDSCSSPAKSISGCATAKGVGHGRRVAARNGGRLHRMARRGLHTFRRLDSGINRRTSRRRCRVSAGATGGGRRGRHGRNRDLGPAH